MGFIPQSGLAFMQQRADPLAAGGGRRNIVAKVVEVQDWNNSVTVVTMDGNLIRHVQVLGGYASTRYGRVGMSASKPIRPYQTPSGPADTAVASGEEDVYAVIDFMDGDPSMPVVVGFLYPENSQMLGLPVNAMERVPGGHYWLVDTNEEGYERVFPDKTYIRFFAANPGRTPLDGKGFDENYVHQGGPPMGFIFYHDPTGQTLFKMLPTGEISWEWLKSVKASMGAEGGVQIDVGEGLALAGPVDFDEKPTAPGNPDGPGDALATLDDVQALIDRGGGGGGMGGGGGLEAVDVYWGELVKAIGDFTTIQQAIEHAVEPDLDLDFTGTEYDTKAECQAKGLRFSDGDTPFPTMLRDTVSGSWSHSAGNGWQPASAINSQGPAILVPLSRPGNWELEVILGYPTQDALLMGYLYLGYIAASNHVGAYADIFDNTGAAQLLQAALWTNSGDDTFSRQWLGSSLSGAGTRIYRFRCENGCVGVWDEKDDSWHWYQGRQNAGRAYTPAHAVIQLSKNSGGGFWTMYVQSLKLTYLDQGITGGGS